MTPFDYVKEIQYGKRNLMVDPQSEKEYKPFIINKTLSYEMDCLMEVNAMNSRHHLSKKMQYAYLLNTVRTRKRPYHKWSKVESSDSIDAIKTFFGYSDQKALEALKILTDEQIEQVIQKTEKGGLIK